ncbi:MAG TPA: TIGR03621 family F420-dependent LLM class oxidoreductase [Pseudonocardiaceae bacterium]|nr:TIGR03621 family F420-dependent LLM class oxidoreductase [Pseudonocardiaceae bacterium]
MSDRKFRFGVVAGQLESPQQWTGLARRVEDAGFSTLLVPDTINVPAPFSALAAAGAVTSTLRLGTFVLAAPLRSAAWIAWETASLDRLSGGRFELGIGAGRPGATTEAELFGVSFGTPKERVDQLADTLRVLRETFETALAGPADGSFTPTNYLAPVQQPKPPILMAVAGPRMLELAAREADIITLALRSDSSEKAAADKVNRLRELAGDRFDELEIGVNTLAVGDMELPARLIERLGIKLDQATGNRSLSVLTGSPAEIADVLLRRRAELGISYIGVNQNAIAQFAPVIELLAGQ